MSEIKSPVIIAGPCSAESDGQLFATASALKGIRVENGRTALSVSMLRAGLWKPRTHPDSFQGVGESGFKWITRIHKELGMRVMVEVASAEHVRIALRHGVDAVWIGARTTTNPFLVQEIASELSGAGIPAFIKNPVNPDLELWAGAVERFRAAGVKEISAIHRGFSYYGRSRYRNEPQWQIPLDFRSRFPEIPLLCDPSHIAGSRTLVAEVAQKAMDLGFDGLFIESHISPDDALSDAAQQITPSALNKLLSDLVLRQCQPSDDALSQRIGVLRSQIDEIDASLLELLAKRMEVSEEIGRCKAEGNITIFQPDRWQQVLDDVSRQAASLGLDPASVREIFKIIHQLSISRQ